MLLVHHACSYRLQQSVPTYLVLCSRVCFQAFSAELTESPDTLTELSCYIYSNKQKETAYSLEMTVKPHNGAIHCCAFSSDGKTVVSSSSDYTAKVIYIHIKDYLYTLSQVV